MLNNFVFVSASVAVLLVGAGVKAQTGVAVQPDSSGSANYEISGTSFSGSTRSSGTILTASVGDAAPYKTGSGIYLYPTMFVGFGYNDNLQTANTGIVASSFVNVAPEVVAELKHKGDRYTAQVIANNVRYASSAADNFNNAEITIAGDNYFTARARAGWSVGQVYGNDARGTFDRPISDTPDRWQATVLNGRAIYGAPEAQGRIEVDLGHQVKTYDTNRTYTELADFTRNSLAGRVFYRLGSRSLVLAELRSTQTDYASQKSTETNTERRYYLGYTWEATAATTGIVKLGSQTKDFANPIRGSYSGNSWEASIRWVPLTYSAFDLVTSRSAVDSSGYGNYDLVTGTDLVWNHRWTSSVHSRISAGVQVTDFAGTARRDSTANYALTVDYALLRWLKVGVDLARSDNSSNVPSAEYRRNISMFTLNASL